MERSFEIIPRSVKTRHFYKKVLRKRFLSKENISLDSSMNGKLLVFNNFVCFSDLAFITNKF